MRSRGARFSTIFLPVCHSELNAIEQLWHHIKGTMRCSLDGSTDKLRSELAKHMPGGCHAPSPDLIAGWFSHVDKYLEAYAQGKSGLEAYKHVRLWSKRRGGQVGQPKKESVSSHHRVPNWVPYKLTAKVTTPVAGSPGP